MCIAITDERGNYSIANLQPGKYTVTFYYGDTTVERNVHVGKDKPQTLDSRIDNSVAGGETIQITATAPSIDVSSTRVGSVPGTHTVGFDGPSGEVSARSTLRSPQLAKLD